MHKCNQPNVVKFTHMDSIKIVLECLGGLNMEKSTKCLLRLQK